MIEPVYLLIACVIATYVGCHLIRMVAERQNLLDVPNARSAHRQPTPTGGGLAIAAVALCNASYLFVVGQLAADFMVVLSGTLAMVLLGLWDDFKPLKPLIRLAAHMGIAIWVLYWLDDQPTLQVMGYHLNLSTLAIPIWSLYLTGLVNSFNFMDGIDGIAASEAIFVISSAIVIAPAMNPYYPYLLATCVGFLIINWPRARLFMGDGGSCFLGLSLGIASLQMDIHQQLSIWCWLILMGYFIVDSALTMIIRFARGERVTEAHNLHAYQHIARWIGARNALYSLWVINLCWLLPSAWVANSYPDMAALVMVAAYLPIIIICLMAGSGQINSKLAAYSVK